MTSWEQVKDYEEPIKRGEAIVDIWTIHDVLEQANNSNTELSESEARDVLFYVEKYHDAEIGINWSVIDGAIDMVVNERGE